MRTPFDAHRSIQRYIAQTLGDAWEVRPDNEEGAAKIPFALVQRVTPTGLTINPQIANTVLGFRVACYPGTAASVERAQARAYEIEEALTQALVLTGAGDVAGPSGLAGTADAGGRLAPGSYVYQVTARPRRGESLPSAPVTVVVASTGSVTLTWNPIPGARSYAVYRGGLLIGIAAPATAPGFIDSGITANANHPVPGASSAVVGAPGRIPLYDYTGIDLDDPATDVNDRPQMGEFLRVTDATITPLAEPQNPKEIAVLCNLRVTWDRVAITPVARQVVDSTTLEQRPS